VFWKLDIHTFPETPQSAQSESGRAFKCTIKVKTGKVRIADISNNSVHPKGLPEAE